MSEADTAGQNAGQQQQFAIQRIYTKDVSFETPNSPAIFTGQWQPEVNVELGSGATRLEDNVYEVTLTLTVTCKAGDKTAYLVEVQQAGIFVISGFETSQLNGMLGSYCPNVLFPYARELVASLVSRGSFPQLLLAPINFDALYAQHLAQQQATAEQDKPVH